MSLASERRAAVDRAFPGVKCKRVTYERHVFSADNSTGNVYPGRARFTLKACIEAPAEVLVAHGLIDQSDVDSLRPSGYGGYGLRKLINGNLQASVSWSDWLDAPTRGRDMAAKIGISFPEKRMRRREEFRPSSPITMGTLVVGWETVAGIIQVDWADIRRQVELYRFRAAS